MCVLHRKLLKYKQYFEISDMGDFDVPAVLLRESGLVPFQNSVRNVIMT